MKVSNDAQSARRCALRLLKFRPRSVDELRRKLQEKAYDRGVVEDTIAYLVKARLLDDRLFAQAWIESRLQRSYGFKRVRQELKLKGIDESLLDEVLAPFQIKVKEDQQLQKIIDSKLERMKSLDPVKQRSRLYGFLVRRGFPRGLVIEALLRRIKSRKETFTDD